MSKMAEKDKIILIVFLFVAVVAALFWFYYKPMTKSISTLKDETKSMSEQKASGKAAQSVVDEFNEDDKKTYMMKEKLYDEAMPKELLPEDIIEKMNVIRARNPLITLATYSLSGASPSAGNQQDSSSQDGQAADISQKYPGLVQVQSVNTSITATYSSFKQFLRNTMNFRPKVLISNVSITSAAAGAADPKLSTGSTDPKLNIGFTMSFVTFNSQELRLNPLPDEKKKPFGEIYKGNIFTPIAGMSATAFKPRESKSAGNVIVNYDSDFYAILNPIKFDPPSLIAGRSKSDADMVTDNKNGVSNVNFTFEGKQGNYTYKCSTDKANNSTTGKFVPMNDGKIVVKIDAHKLKGSPDNVGANASITNNSDILVEVNVVGDDPQKRRVMVKKLTANNIIENDK